MRVKTKVVQIKNVVALHNIVLFSENIQFLKYFQQFILNKKQDKI